jgi:hypothetical protein
MSGFINYKISPFPSLLKRGIFGNDSEWIFLKVVMSRDLCRTELESTSAGMGIK